METQDTGEETQRFAAREADWRVGALVYQVIVDRFAPGEPAALAEKTARGLYAPPRRLRAWHETPAAGSFQAEFGVWRHEVDFWGGDLPSLRGRLDYVAALGAEVLYLNPIAKALTNHKYDTDDFLTVSPEYGTEADLRALIEALHARGLRLVLDGVFNHVGRHSRLFQTALKNPDSPERAWFWFGEEYPQGVRLWQGSPNLPELRLENPAVTEYLYRGRSSVLKHYLGLGIDGWRLDAAFELGFAHLAALRDQAHQARPGSLVVGEIPNYPARWTQVLDGVMNFTFRELILGTVRGSWEPGRLAHLVDQVCGDCGLEALLRSWILLDNHDVPRLATELPDEAQRRLALVLQFTLPGCPNIYYGSELGMSGGGDPEMRAPMRWDLTEGPNPTREELARLIQLRRQHRALKIGDWTAVDSSRLVCFLRTTDRAAETLLVVLNPGADPVREAVLIPEARLMNDTLLEDQLAEAATPGARAGFRLSAGVLRLEVPGQTAFVLQPRTEAKGGYTPYKRVP